MSATTSQCLQPIPPEWEPKSTNVPSIGEINDQNAPGMRVLPGGDDDGREQQILLGAAAHTHLRRAKLRSRFAGAVAATFSGTPVTVLKAFQGRGTSRHHLSVRLPTVPAATFMWVCPGSSQCVVTLIREQKKTIGLVISNHASAPTYTGSLETYF